MRRVYLDSSAYVTLLMGDPGSAGVEAAVEGAHVLSSVLLVLEAHRALIHATRTRRLAHERLQPALERIAADLELLELRDLTPDLCGSRPMPLASTPRALDLAHLRTALWFHGEQPLAGFVTLDERQRIAARELGLPVSAISPS